MADGVISESAGWRIVRRKRHWISVVEGKTARDHLYRSSLVQAL